MGVQTLGLGAIAPVQCASAIAFGDIVFRTAAAAKQQAACQDQDNGGELRGG